MVSSSGLQLRHAAFSSGGSSPILAASGPVRSTVASLRVLVLPHCHGPVLFPALSLGCHDSGLAADFRRFRFTLKQGQDVRCQQIVSLRTRVDRIWAPERQQKAPAALNYDCAILGSEATA